MRIIFLVLIILGLTTLPLNAADYGVRVRDAQGRVIINIDDSITRLIYVSTQTATSGNSGALSQIAGLRTVEFAIPVNCTASLLPHDVTRSGTTITWTSKTLGAVTSPATCVMFCFAYS